jgi:hypothetical protein
LQVRSVFLARLIGEPMLHFALIGIALFLVYGSRNDTAIAPDAAAVIEITPQLADRLASQFKGVWQRDPSPEEREALINDFIREEVLYRDALALGLDRDDAVIRQRMRLKMELLSDGMAGSLVPDDATLAAWFEPRAQEFAPPPRVTFLQVQLQPAEDAAALLARLNDGADPRDAGRGSLLPQRLEAATPQVVDGSFGVGFYDALATAPEDRWSGPVESAYGPHLVKILVRSGATRPSFDTVRDAVLHAWRREQAQALREAQFDALTARYRIVRSDGARQ